MSTSSMRFSIRLGLSALPYGTSYLPGGTFQFGSATVNDFSHAIGDCLVVHDAELRLSLLGRSSQLTAGFPPPIPAPHTATAIASIDANLVKCSLDESARALRARRTSRRHS